MFLIDDCLATKEMRSGHQGSLALLSTYSRHADVYIFWVSQTYSKLPKPIRLMSDLNFLGFTDPADENMFIERFNKHEINQYKDLYKEQIQEGPQYGWWVIDSNASNKHEKTRRLYLNTESGYREPINVN